MKKPNAEANRPVITMANHTEALGGRSDHVPPALTSRAPRFMPDGPPVSRTRPASETSVAAHVHQWIGWPKRRLISGVKTTNSPVINPALPGLVMVSPAVWVRYPAAR